jgi:hypothetical protein
MDLKSTADITSVKDMLHEHDIRLKSLEISTQGQEGRWKGIFSFIVQLIWVITAAFLLYHFGIQAPAIP